MALAVKQDYQKAQIIEKAILRIRDNKEDIAQVFKELDLDYKSNTYYTLKKKYEKDGFDGLLSKRDKSGRKAEKGKSEVLDFIKVKKQRCDDIKANELQAGLKSSMNIDISVSQINRLINKLEIKNIKGRPAQKKEIRLDQAGLFIFLAAVLETNYIDELLKTQQKILENEAKTNNEKLSKSGSLIRGGITEEKGIFSKDVKGRFIDYPKESKEDYEINGGMSNKFKSVSERVKNRDLGRLSLFQVRESTLYRKNLTLLCLPIVTKHSRFSELNETIGNELKYFCGYNYKSSTIDKYARELKYLQSSNIFMNQMANFWYHFWKRTNNESTSQVCYYFDGNTNPLWSKYSVKQSKVSKVGRVMGCLENVYLHSHQGHPLMLQTFSGGVYLPDAIKKLHIEMDKIMPEIVNRVSIFDAGANSVDFYETFKDREYFICVLDSNQYKQDLSDIEISGRENIDGNIYIEARKKLKNSKTGLLYDTRIAVYKRWNRDRYVAFVTNIDKNKMGAAEIIESYYKRWPNQENQFRDMNNGGDISTNYGFGKQRVINLVVKKNMKYLDEQIKKKNKKQREQGSLEIIQTEKKIEQSSDKNSITKLLKDLKRLYGKTEKQNTDMAIMEAKTKDKIATFEKQKKRQEYLLNKHQKEYNRIKKKELVYQNDVELNQLLSCYKIAFANLSAYILQEYFSGLTMSIEKLMSKIYKRPGKLIIKGKRKEIQIYLNKKDNYISEKIISACKIINSKQIKWNKNDMIKLTPVLVEE